MKVGSDLTDGVIPGLGIPKGLTPQVIAAGPRAQSIALGSIVLQNGIGLIVQSIPGSAAWHAMSEEGQTVPEAQALAGKFIASKYQSARETSSPALSCLYRGMAMHTVMDSTSPAHQSYQKWNMMSAKAFHHGSLPSSHEDDESHAKPGTFARTAELMRTMDRAGLSGAKIPVLP
jgi:hypothetical protein